MNEWAHIDLIFLCNVVNGVKEFRGDEKIKKA